MRRFSNPFRLLALAGVLSVTAWGCSTDSPTAPRQEVPPTPPGSNQSYYISVGADPGGIVISQTAPTGAESTTLLVEVRLNGPNGPRPADGTTALVTTSLGSFTNIGFAQEVGVELVNGKAFLTLFSGGVPVQLGTATVLAYRGNNSGQARVPIALLEALFITSNPEDNLSVQFRETAAGNPTSFFWEFGDGTTSDDPNPNHLFPGPGTYQVFLTVSKRVNGVLLEDTVTMPVSVAEEVVVP